MNMEMIVYKVLETGWAVGYIEFVDNSDVITAMHKWRGRWWGPFAEKCMYEYFKQEVYPKIFKQNLNEIQLKLKDSQKDRKNDDVRVL